MNRFEKVQTRGPDIKRTPGPLMNVQPQAPEAPGKGTIFGALVQQIMAEGKTLDQAIEEVQAKLAAKAEELAGVFQGALIAAVADVATGGNLGQAIAGIIGDMLSALGQMAVQFGLEAIGIATLMQEILHALASLNPVVAIAAGVALVALGSALKGAASKSFGGTTASGPSLQPINTTVSLSAPASTSAPQAGGTAAAAKAPMNLSILYLGGPDPRFDRWLGERVAAAQARGAV